MRATVNVSYDEGSEERTDEVYDPSVVATLSMHKSEQVSEVATRLAAFRERQAILRRLARGAGCGDRRLPCCAGDASAAAETGVAGISAARAGEWARLCMKRMVPTESQNIWCTPSRARGGCAACTAAVVVNDRSVTEGRASSSTLCGSREARRDAAARGTGAGGGRLRRNARRPGGDAECELQYECS